MKHTKILKPIAVTELNDEPLMERKKGAKEDTQVLIDLKQVVLSRLKDKQWSQAGMDRMCMHSEIRQQALDIEPDDIWFSLEDAHHAELMTIIDAPSEETAHNPDYLHCVTPHLLSLKEAVSKKTSSKKPASAKADAPEDDDEAPRKAPPNRAARRRKTRSK